VYVNLKGKGKNIPILVNLKGDGNNITDFVGLKEYGRSWDRAPVG
jgi:hypothetical protein